MQTSKRLLDPTVRAGEILFGLIMALTFTCSVSIVNTNRTEVRQLLIAALSCNFAWGLIDGIMFLVSQLVKQGRNRAMFNVLRGSANAEESKTILSKALPPVVASVISDDEFEKLREKLAQLPEGTVKVKLTSADFKKSFALFLLVFLSTFPVVIPFLFIHNTQLALRISNSVAIIMMFFCGWIVAGYVGFNRWIMSFAIVLIGLLLVAITISLGG